MALAFRASAGAQFVYRFLYYMPEARASAFIAANADKLRKTPEAEHQGPNRRSRGLKIHSLAKASAERIGAAFNWQVFGVDDADHSNAKMAP